MARIDGLSLVGFRSGALKVRHRLGERDAHLDAHGVAMEAVVEVRADQPAVSQGSGPILIVDDEEPLRRMCRQILTAKGYDVHTAAHGEEALAMAAKTAYHLSLIHI